MHGLPVAEADWRKKFFLVWRFWEERAVREKNPLLAYLVAGTRIPDHTLWHHNGLVSAMEGAGNKPAFLIFQIGPVQDFIAQARKTQDLWSGSYLLSFLISKALALLAVRLGPDAVVYPNLRGSPLLDWWWSQEEDLFPPGALRLGEGRLHPNELLTPCLPNRFLALIPADAGRQLASDLENAVRKLWEKIADSVHADICAKLQDQLRQNELAGWDAQWQQQVARFPVIDWAIHEWPGQDKAIENAQQDTPPIGEGWKQSALAHAMA